MPSDNLAKVNEWRVTQCGVHYYQSASECSYSSCCQDNRMQTAAAKAAAALWLLPLFRETWDLLEQPYPACSQESEPGNSCPSKPVDSPTLCHLSLSRKLLAKCRKVAMLEPVNDAVPCPSTSPCGPQDKSEGSSAFV